MNDVWQTLIGIAAGLIACWLILLAVLALARPKGNLLTEAVRLSAETSYDP